MHKLLTLTIFTVGGAIGAASVLLTEGLLAKPPAQYAYLTAQQVDVPAKVAKSVAAWASEATSVSPDAVAGITFARSGDKVIARVQTVASAQAKDIPAGVTLLGLAR